MLRAFGYGDWMPKVKVIDTSKWSAGFIRREQQRMAIEPLTIDKVLKEQYLKVLEAELKRKVFSLPVVRPPAIGLTSGYAISKVMSRTPGTSPYAFSPDVYSTTNTTNFLSMTAVDPLTARILAIDPLIKNILTPVGGTVDPLDERSIVLHMEGGERIVVALDYVSKGGPSDFADDVVGRVTYAVRKWKAQTGQRPLPIASRQVALTPEHLLCNDNGKWMEKQHCKVHAEELKDACTHDGRIVKMTDCKQHWEEWEARCQKPQEQTPVSAPSAATPTTTTARSAKPSRARSTSASAATTRRGSRHSPSAHQHVIYQGGCRECDKDIKEGVLRKKK